MKIITRFVDFLLAPFVSRVAAAVTRQYDEGRYHGNLIRDERITNAVRESLDYGALATEVALGDALIERVCDSVTAHVCKDTLTECIAGRLDIKAADIATCVDLSSLVEYLDMDDIETNIANKVSISASDVAEHVDAYHIAQLVDMRELASEIDSDDIARHVEVDAEAVAGYVEVDMDTLSEVIVNDDASMAALGRAIVRSLAGKATV